ncbi:hypothetical protein AMTRI_Chr07g29930 [Amborella trichopoda]|uniref:ELM2 domain-containing protein n=2 Tax=Amborella trichopoda TaxID=13333 RepID=W1NGN6_AMBTC|nr:hypothetical protein AMTR_s00009p00212620 [Amborella trichopoda]
MYEDLVRSSQRLLALQNNRLSLLASSPSKCRVPNNNKVDHIFIENHPLDSLSPLSKENPLSIDRFSRKLVPVGPYFQAQVPDRVDVKRKVSLGESGFSDDSKWLGRQIWPFKGSNVVTERESIGKGRALMCSCYLPGSVECIRSHISEKRQRLRAELGSAFFNWRFYDMGEEVSTFWTEREEQRFKALVRLNSSSLDNSFWCQASACFSAKSKEEIVSYYFNVFLLRRRSYQNRFTPRNIDSDDEEFEPGFLSNDLGVKMGMDSGSRTSICAKNSQCQDLDFMDMDMEQSVEV